MSYLRCFVASNTFVLCYCSVCLRLVSCVLNVTSFSRLFIFNCHFGILEPLNRNESGRFGALKSDSTHHFFRNACTKSGSLRFHSFPGC